MWQIPAVPPEKLKGKENPDLPLVCSNYWPPNVALRHFYPIMAKLDHVNLFWKSSKSIFLDKNCSYHNRQQLKLGHIDSFQLYMSLIYFHPHIHPQPLGTLGLFDKTGVHNNHFSPNMLDSAYCYIVLDSEDIPGRYHNAKVFWNQVLVQVSVEVLKMKEIWIWKKNTFFNWTNTKNSITAIASS